MRYEIHFYPSQHKFGEKNNKNCTEESWSTFEVLSRVIFDGREVCKPILKVQVLPALVYDTTTQNNKW